MNELNIYYTNSLEELARKLAADLAVHPLPPLISETMIVPSEGMAYWLRLQLASLTGCAAGLTMLFPGNFCRQLTAAEVFRPEDQLWEIYGLLTSPAFTAPFENLSAYLRDRDPLKPLQLARRLYTLFDSYLIYRHEMLLRWEAGETGRLPHEDWQAELWRNLRSAPRAGAFQRLLDNPNTAPLPPRLSVFGVGTLPPLFLEFLRRLATIRPVSLYQPAPTPHYWADIRPKREALRLSLKQMIPNLATSAANAQKIGANGEIAESGDNTDWLHYDCGNPLLADFARQGREFFTLLAGASASGQGWQELAWRENGETSVLGVLQDDILHLRNREHGKGDTPLPLDPTDRSLQLHCCHSPLREVEVLHDQILDALQADSTLQPSDILVLMTNPSDYAPWVRTVFGASPTLAPHFRLTDHSAAESNPLAQALLEIIQLPQGRQEVSTVLGLLDHAPIREAAGITGAELPELRRMVQELNIRWGVGSAPYAQTSSDAADAPIMENSWQAGLERLLLGYATGELPDGGLICDIAPCFPGNSFDLAGRFANWAQRLFYWCDLLKARPRPLEEWRRLLSRLCRELLGQTGSDEDTGDWLRLPPLSGEVNAPLEAIREYVNGTLQAEGGRGAFIGGGISFCALRPLRSVPFRVIAVLGLDYTRFPRRDRREAFDLQQQRPRFGDRSQRDDDCQLFLETILSARQRLILLYSGHSDTGISTRPAAVCVGQLLEVIDRSFVCAASEYAPSQHLTIEHPLQPFSPGYFPASTEGSALFTYAARYRPPQATSNATQPFLTHTLPVPATGDNLALSDLLRFWKNPACWLCERTLHISFPREDEELPPEEPLSPTGLERFHLRQYLTERRLSVPAGKILDIQAEQTYLAAQGTLPPQKLGAAWYGCLNAEVGAFVERLGVIGHLPPLPMRVQLKEICLCGTLTRLTTQGQLLYRPSTLNANDRLAAWIQHLFWNAATLPDGFLTGERKTRVVGLDSELLLMPCPQAQATEILSALSAQMREGCGRTLPFFPRSSFAYASDSLAPTSGRKVRRPAAAALLQWAGDSFGHLRPERADPYIALCFPGDTPPAERADFVALAEEFWKPFLNYAAEPQPENAR